MFGLQYGTFIFMTTHTNHIAILLTTHDDSLAWT